MGEVAVAISCAGKQRGSLRLATLRERPDALLRDRTDDPTRLGTEASVQVAEAQTYWYEIAIDQPTVGPLTVEPRDLFSPDPAGQHGRFSPGEAVGDVEVTVSGEGAILGTALVEVRPRKLKFYEEYRQMLRDVSEIAADALLQGFAPSAGTFRSSQEEPADLLFRRFAYVYARMRDTEFRDVVAYVLGRPHRDWAQEDEQQSISRPVRGHRGLPQSLLRGQPRREWLGRPAAGRLTTLPCRIDARRHEATYNTVPNQMVRHALEDWRALAERTRVAALQHLRGASRQRGDRATSLVLDLLDEWLGAPLFADVDTLRIAPTGNQVLLKREGYRQVFAAWALTTSGVEIAPPSAEPFRITQRDVATLYEYWCFLQLAAVLRDLCGGDGPGAVFARVGDGMALALKDSRITWEVNRAGRALALELSFNRTFGASKNPFADGSWSRAMRPDCSLHVRPITAVPSDVGEIDLWLHFDAKYRLDFLKQQFSAPPSDDYQHAAEAELVETLGASKRADLLKMHAYKDAIRKTAGAYVLFPGTEPGVFPREAGAEALPGIGAFPLRPSVDLGAPGGAAELSAFLESVLDHAADQATRHERLRFWTRRIVAGPGSRHPLDAPAAFLSAPPADEPVLAIELSSAEAASQMLGSETVIIPADQSSAEAEAPQLLLLHGAGMPWTAVVRRVGEWWSIQEGPDGMPGRGCGIDAIPDAPAWLQSIAASKLHGPGASLALVTWYQLTRLAYESS